MRWTVQPPECCREWFMSIRAREPSLESLTARVAALEQALAALQSVPLPPRGCVCSSATAAVPAVQATGSGGAVGVNASSDTGVGVIAHSGSGVGLVAAGGGAALDTSPGIQAAIVASGGPGPGYAVWANSDGYSTAVYGQSVSGDGVAGQSTSHNGVVGSSDSGDGVVGSSTSRNGVYGQSTNGDGILGLSSYTGVGVRGIGHTGIAGMSDDHIGVYGWTEAGDGVVGESTAGNGVTGQSASGAGVYGQSTSDAGVAGQSTGGWGVIGDSDSRAGVLGRSPSGYGVAGVSDSSVGVSGLSNGVDGIAVAGWNQGGGDGVYGASYGGGHGVHGDSFGGDGVHGSSNTGEGVYGESSTGDGVYGESNSATGVYGHTASGFAGVVGEGDPYGVVGVSAFGLAGYFQGNVIVTGALLKPGGGFRIDHPLDGAGKYLSHSFVESPDMKNLYDGVVRLDASGQAEVALPAWFGALNSDVRYQLCCLGGHAPVYIAETLRDNRFTIAGGQPEMVVCWQVTGIRHDRWASAHRVPVEQDKPAAERGRYLHPELYGESEEKGLLRLPFSGRPAGDCR
jgi:hypothetical protein